MSRICGRRARALSVLSLLVVGASLPAPVAAGEVFPALRFTIDLGSGCISGAGEGGDKVTVTVRTPDGTLRGRSTTRIDSSDHWSTCGGFGGPIAFVTAGDRVTVSDSYESRTLRVPYLTASVDRVSDQVSGHAPNGADLWIKVIHTLGYGTMTRESTKPAVADADGSYSTSFREIKGRDEVRVRWHSGSDSVLAVVVAPYVTLRTNDQLVTGAANIGTPVTVSIMAPGGEMRGSMTTDPIALSGGLFIGTFTAPGGRLVYPRSGDTVVGSFATDAEMVVPQMQLRGHAAADALSGRCLPDRPYRVQIMGERHHWLEITEFSGYAAEDGTFHVGLVHFDLRAGDDLQMACLTTAGDEVGRGAIAH